VKAHQEIFSVTQLLIDILEVELSKIRSVSVCWSLENQQRRWSCFSCLRQLS